MAAAAGDQADATARWRSAHVTSSREPAGRTRSEWNRPWRKRCPSVSEPASSDVWDGDLLFVDLHDVTSVEVGRTVFDGRTVFAR
ncbi:hypothetical protein ABT150_30805 [Streptomyces mirabilis]|uniref:hypothetical protein n=1 Tax=Streptomyces mirabilis TaxID=68239 RepID=UPI003330487E